MEKLRLYNKNHPLLMDTVKALLFPLAVFIVFEILDLAFAGVHLMASGVDVVTLFRNLISSFLFALALNCNMPMGRMDLSAGAQMYLGCILGGNIALSLGFGGVGLLLLSILIGGIAGGIVGLLFVNLRILPMVLGLGMTLVYECISFSLNNQNGLNLYGNTSMDILSNINFIILIGVIVVVLFQFLFRYSAYGYERSAIQGSQKLANDAGLNIYTNCVVCYILAGCLVAAAGVFDTAYKTQLTPVLGMSSNSQVFTAMFPMVVGGYLGRKTSPVFGMVLGALSVQFLVLGLSKFITIGLSSNWQTLIKYICWLVFMIWTANEDKLHQRKARKERIQLAKETRAKMA